MSLDPQSTLVVSTLRSALTIALLATNSTYAADFAWKCPDGSIQLLDAKSCLGANRIAVEAMNAAELNGYVKAQRAADDAAQRKKLADENARSRIEAAEKNRKQAECSAAFGGKPPVTNSGWDGSVPSVKQYLMNNLKDPGSYDSIEWSKVVPGCGTYVVRHRYRAKNSFGGYVINNVIFSLDADGVVTGASNIK